MTKDEMLIDALKALAHPVRWKIVSALVEQERNVGDIEEAIGVGQPALSQQLAVLRAAGLVETRRVAKLVYYRLDTGRLDGVAGRVGELVGSAAPAPKAAAKRPPSGAATFARLA